MRILLFYGWDIQALGGAEISVCQLAEALIGAGHSVGIADIRPDLSERSLGLLRVPYWSTPSVPFPRGIRSGARFLHSAWRVGSVLREFRPDVVSVQCPVLQCHLLVAASLLHRRHRLVVTVRGSDIRDLSNYPYLKSWQTLLLKRADSVIAVSRSLLQDLLALYPSVRNKAQVIPNGLDRSWFDQAATPPTDSGRYVLFVGRLHVIKGVDLLLRAWSLVQERVPRVKLWLVGEGQELEGLRSLSEQLGVSTSVRFKGYKTPAELRSLYRDAAVVVIPSRNEGLPRVSLEAGACRAIRVATRVGGIPETIQGGVTGVLVDPESPEALADGILRALHLPEPERRHMSAAARDDVRQQFNLEKMVARYEEIFQLVLWGRAEHPTR